MDVMRDQVSGIFLLSREDGSSSGGSLGPQLCDATHPPQAATGHWTALIHCSINQPPPCVEAFIIISPRRTMIMW
ncbi:hypothetical protein NHX12_010866 [Muraenolepis orangiensis]|uniref:Uncharacterized protein n=1 Tax=Muraenolepis orangiensis TaxID=630683 RepID=A0A9Q0DGS1_9TELE|nr:hypothetical protein NHX12_010866 [Muraenolepis orangiensis]